MLQKSKTEFLMNYIEKTQWLFLHKTLQLMIYSCGLLKEIMKSKYIDNNFMKERNYSKKIKVRI